jgi:hypothetical protein
MLQARRLADALEEALDWWTNQAPMSAKASAAVARLRAVLKEAG